MPLSKYDIDLELTGVENNSHAHMLDLARPGDGVRVLDVGCDTGYFGEVLTQQGSQVWGVEIDEVTATAARTKLIDVVVGDLEVVDLAELLDHQRFDVVVFGDVLEHLRDPLPVLRQAHELLAPGGGVLISTPNVAHGDIRLALLSGRFRYTPTGILDNTHTRFFTTESLIEFVHDAGFVITDLRRATKPLFTTETELDPADYPADVIEPLQDDLEANTYQFVIRIEPGTPGSPSEPAVQLDAARIELHRTRAQLARAQAASASTPEASAAPPAGSRAERLPAPLQEPARRVAARLRRALG